MVAQVLEDGDPAGAGQHLLERRQRPPVHRCERAPVHGEAGRGRQRVVLDDEDVGARLLEDVPQRRQPSLGEQDRAHLVTGGDGAADRSLALRDEQPLDLLGPRSQLDVAERHEVPEARIGEVGDALDRTHTESLSPCSGASYGLALSRSDSGSTAQECMHSRQTSSRTGVPAATRPCSVSLPDPQLVHRSAPLASMRQLSTRRPHE